MNLVVCPSCDARLRLPDRLPSTGKTLQCPKCKKPVQIPAASEAAGQSANGTDTLAAKGQIQSGPAPSRPLANLQAPVNEPPQKKRDRDDEDYDDEPRAQKKRSREEEDEDEPRARRRRDRDDDDEDNDERPSRRRSSRDDDDYDDEPRSRRRRDDDDDDYDDEPRSRRRRDDDYDDEPRSRRPRSRYDDDDDDYGRRRGPKPISKSGWRKVHDGIGWVYMGNCLALGAMAAALAGILMSMVIGMLTRSGGAAVAFVFIGLIAAGFLGLGALVLKFIGYVGCLESPEKHAAKILAMVTLCVAIGAILLPFLGFVHDSIGKLGMLCGVAEWIVFLFFMRSLALNVKARQLATSIVHLLIGWAIYLVAIPIFTVIFVMIGFIGTANAVQHGFAGNHQGMFGNLMGTFAALGIAAFIFFIIFAAAFLVLCAWYFQNLVRLRDEIGNTVDRRAPTGTPAWVPLLGGNVGLLVLMGIVGLISIARAGAAINDMKQDLNNAPHFVNPPNFNPPNLNPPNPFGPGPGPGMPNNALKQTRENYDRIQLGMTEAEVINLVGNPGFRHPNQDGPGTMTFQYSLGFVRFKDGRVVGK